MRGILSAILLIIIGFLLSESTAFAQVLISVSDVPVPGSNDFAIRVAGNLIADFPRTTTTLKITFPGPVVSDPNDPIRIEGADGLFAAVSAVTDSAAGVIRIILPGSPPSVSNAQSGVFRLVGGRVYGVIHLALDSPANNYLLAIGSLLFGPCQPSASSNCSATPPVSTAAPP